MNKYDWLLFLHVTGAFSVVGGAVIAGVLNVAALQRERPSEIAALLRLTRVAVALIGAGMVLTLGFGLWLVDDAGYGYGDGWVVAAIVLWVVGNALGGAGGRPLGEAGDLARRLAADGDRPSEELRRALVDRRALLLNYLSLAALVAILVLMVWKPGA